MYFYKLMFINTLMISTLITISSYSWFSMWIGLEINLLSFIPLMKNYKNSFSTESSIKYFIAQAMASVILLFSIMLILINMFKEMNNLMMIILNSSIFMKMGAAPFHFWFPLVMEGLNWMNCLILLTWQKIAPMIISSYLMFSSTFFMFIIIMSSLIGSIKGLNQTKLRKLMAYSSINHISWMLSMMLYSSFNWLVYFITYIFINFNTIIFLFNMNSYNIKQLYLNMNNNMYLKMTFMLNFLSLSGLPPFLGFFPKWITINCLTEMNLNFLSLILILSSIITLYFYLNLAFSSLIIMYPQNFQAHSKKIPLMFIYMNLFNIMSILIMSLILI
uniref:NADH-ubiquinone oxidoreductase chain 2 n=1 Tax=Cucujoidea sp. 13 KM-2017 TaxID=2219349 RepID=A0A346RJZ2_9CUCU|nr:NADH dehydrogenase subunit 2 [Cucujoidea sp. 13 KM-2017]